MKRITVFAWEVCLTETFKSSRVVTSFTRGRNRKNDWDQTNYYTLNMVTTELQEDEGHEAFLLFTCCSEYDSVKASLLSL